jgi:hypothetical protein
LNKETLGAKEDSFFIQNSRRKRIEQTLKPAEKTKKISNKRRR